MDAETLDIVRSAVEDASLVFEDSDQIALFNGKENLGRWSLSEMVDGLLDAMGSDEEVDDMLDLSRHLAFLAKRIRNVVGDHVQTRGEP